MTGAGVCACRTPNSTMEIRERTEVRRPSAWAKVGGVHVLGHEIIRETTWRRHWPCSNCGLDDRRVRCPKYFSIECTRVGMDAGSISGDLYHYECVCGESFTAEDDVQVFIVSSRREYE